MYIQITASTSAGSGPPTISDLVIVPEASEFYVVMPLHILKAHYLNKCISHVTSQLALCDNLHNIAVI